jgi:hypothetical protein
MHITSGISRDGYMYKECVAKECEGAPGLPSELLNAS